MTSLVCGGYSQRERVCLSSVPLHLVFVAVAVTVPASVSVLVSMCLSLVFVTDGDSTVWERETTFAAESQHVLYPSSNNIHPRTHTSTRCRTKLRSRRAGIYWIQTTCTLLTLLRWRFATRLYTGRWEMQRKSLTMLLA